MLQLPVWKRKPTERNKNLKGYASIYHLIRMLYISLNYDPFPCLTLKQYPLV